ncbi:MAG: heme exporter protein CcmD [Jannaschia sp.]
MTDPDTIWLGKYAFDILLAYGLSIVLIVGLVVQSVAASRATRRRLGEAEE